MEWLVALLFIEAFCVFFLDGRISLILLALYLLPRLITWLVAPFILLKALCSCVFVYFENKCDLRDAEKESNEVQAGRSQITPLHVVMREYGLAD